ncbi:tape measure protein [Acinetobacter baumannii]|uniref:tape measure protein n=5 Tax=Acinetobacter baumannii TaxID=470 RepID=UPI0009D500EF|nr:tape measure protein [Acinetobacter baumannii]TLT61159.1 tape measure protein [Acinetobacter baumannii]SLM55688.1 membrane-bound lytic murein transglycosylase D [Acinetobacter baumannii]SMB69530.1 membrane-bound lytic murein transglycosylase D [Acinetobacter baumannii]SMD57299.1 membrane-bound lytic murein transglycosylase D [Acinetobacter baumannii]
MAQEARLVIVIDSERAKRTAQDLSVELDSITKKGDFASKSMDSLSVATRALAGHMAGLLTVSSAISKMDTYTGLQNRLKLVTNNQVELNKATEDTFRIAQKTYSAWDSVLQVYQRFSDNAKTLNLTMDDTARLTETVSKAVAISGASAEAADAALVQFGQALASGTLRGEELNSVMEQTPALAKAIAKGMGITVGELRSVAAEGKITSQEIVKALRNVESDVDALFAKTDITIGQSLTLLNNEITKFVGEAGKGSGAAQTLAEGIQILASNLDLIADGALVVGIGYITRAILMKSAAIKEGMASTLASRQASVLNAQAEYAEATAALNAAKAHLANVRATNAETQAKFGATAAATRYAQAQAAVTAATNAQTAAQIKLNTATSIAGRLAKGAFGLIGGWAGVATLGVMGLAAAYSYFNNKAEEAKQKLAEQAKVAEKADEELKKLTGNDKAKAVNDLTTAFNAQNKALEKSSRAVGSALIDIENYARGNREVEKISQEARTGTISYTEAIERLNKIKLPADLYENLKKQAAQYDENSSKASLSAEKLKLFGVEVSLAGNKAQNAAAQHQKQADALGNTGTAAETAEQKLKKLRENANKSMLDDQYWINNYIRNKQLLGEAGAKDFADFTLAWRKENEIGREVKLSKEQLQVLHQQWEMHQKVNALRDEATAAINEQNKALKNQQKVLNVNAKVLANASKFGFADLESKYKLPSGTLSAIHMIESRGNAKAYNKETGATGGFQFLEGTAKQYGVKDRTDLAQSAEGAAKYMSYLLKLFKGDLEKAVRAYHAGEGNVMKGKGIGKNNDQYWKDYQSYMAGINGYSAGDISSKEFGSYLRDFAKTQEEIKQLQITYDSEAVARSKRREEEINKATLLGQMDLLPKIKERFDAEEKLAQKQFDFEVNGYKWTEEQKLDYTYETNSLRLVAEGKLSEDQRQVALDGLKLQKQQELGLLKLAQEQRLFQAEQFMLGEMERIKKRYALEYDEISKITDLEERRRKMSAFQADFIRNGVGNPTIDQYDTSSQFLKSTNYTKPKQTNMQVLDEDYAQTYQKLKDNLAAVLESEKASYQERLEAQRVFKEARQQMEDEYYLKAVDARKSDYENQLMQLGSLTSQLDSYWSNMTGIVKNAAGEQSGLYKGMYIAQQAFAISSATISALQAYNQILASPWYLDVISKSTAANLVLGMGMANVGLIAGQTIAGFSDGGFTGSGGKYEPAGIVHKGEVVWSQEDIRRWGGVGLVENMRKSANPEAFLNNKASADSVMRRAMMSSSAFIESQKQADIFNQPVQDTQIIYKGNRDTPKLASSANSDLFHDGKVYFSSNGLVQDRSNLEDVQDFTMGQAARPQAEMMPSIEPSTPTINFKIEVINQVSGATVEAEQLDEQTVRIIVTDELDKQLPRKVPKLVSDQIGNPNSTISRSLTENTTARRNR